MKTYEGWFEGEYGLELFEVEADSPRQASRKLAKMFPKDVGADGEMTDSDGYDHPITW